MSQSGFNPVGGHGQLMGDLLYLHVLTLENKNIHITCSVKGFVINCSELHHLDRRSRDGRVYSSLVDLLQQNSEGFRR